MTKHIIGFFCGTGYSTGSSLYEGGDASYQHIIANVSNDTKIFGYDGCQVHGGGAFSYGVEEQADAFIAELKRLKLTEPIQLNLIAHSRGVLSALIAIKKIQADPELKGMIEITADFRDPVPGNFQITTKFAGNLASANLVHDLSECDIVKKVFITLQEKPIIPLAFDALVPKFHYRTKVEIETLPGYHDVQQRAWEANREIEFHEPLLMLGNAKTLAILKDDGHQLPYTVGSKSLDEQQIDAYERLLPWARAREMPFGERDLHFGGKLIANNAAKTDIDAINWRHALLKRQIPNHILYGTTQPDYNYRKDNFEHYCDLTLALDNFLVKNKDKQAFVEQIRNISQRYLYGTLTTEDYRAQCKAYFVQASVQDKQLNKAINFMSLNSYLIELERTIAELSQYNPLLGNLQALKLVLLSELEAEIQAGKSLEEIDASKAIKIAHNTTIFIKDILEKTNPLEIIEATDKYAKENIRLGRNWNLGAKIIIGAIVCIAATLVGAIIGAAAGIAIGLAVGAISGPGALATAGVGAFIGGLKGAIAAATLASGAVGLGSGLAAANYFFKPSPVENEIQALAKATKTEAEADLHSQEFAF
ncbi:hypothetical protein [Legionella cardiaca]|uniref:Dot/Icm T4SS effector n=1 Tax=Legionella cardiaca TaxID=1071983 RepID=A0ABY8ASW9_9GAMM|nr:hypothetical protein [Legionella cardiaca]WED43301.1 hypothetical protein PXX05_00560 [Legionella cardiaca]